MLNKAQCMGHGSVELLVWPKRCNISQWPLVCFRLYTISVTTHSRSCVFPVLAQAFAQNWEGLLICRLFMGLGKFTHFRVELNEY